MIKILAALILLAGPAAAQINYPANVRNQSTATSGVDQFCVMPRQDVTKCAPIARITASTGAAELTAPLNAAYVSLSGLSAEVRNLPTINVSTFTGPVVPGGLNTPGYQFKAYQDFGAFTNGNADTHIGFVISGGKNRDAATTVGSWQLFSVRYEGDTAPNIAYGGAANANITAAQFLMHPHPGMNNNHGAFTGSNPECILDVGMQAEACIGEEIDVEVHSPVSATRQALRIADIGSEYLGGQTDSAIGIIKCRPPGCGGTTAGFRNAILLGDETDTGGISFPLPTGGNVLKTATSSTVLRSYFDFSKLVAPSSAGLVMPFSGRAICFAADCSGGELSSAGAVIAIGFAGGKVTVDGNGALTSPGYITAARLRGALRTPASSSEACLAGEQAADASYFYVCTAPNTWKRVALGAF